jgi:hypothetical protein
MADFNFKLALEILGESNLRNAIKNFESLGVKVEQIKKSVKDFNGVLRPLNTVKISADSEESLKRAAEHIKNQYFYSKKMSDLGLNQRPVYVRNMKSEENDREKVLREEQKVRRKIAKLAADELKELQKHLGKKEAEEQKHAEKKFKIDEASAKKLAATREKFAKREEDQRERVLQFEQKTRRKLANLAEAEIAKEQRAKEAAINEEIRARRKLEREKERQLRQSHVHTEKEIGLLKKIQHQVYAIRYGMLSVHHAAGLLGFFAVERFGRSFAGAVQKSIEFNDELKQTRTLLESFGTADTQKSITELESSSDKSDQEKLAKARSVATDMTKMLREEAAITGQSLSEVMGATKTFLPNIMNKFGGGKNALRDHSEEIKGLTKDFIDLSVVLKMVDANNRKLSFHAYAIEEVFGGSSKGKGAGSQNFLSLLRRENIKLFNNEKEAITAAIDAHDPVKAMALFKEALARSGFTTAKIKDLMEKTLKPNVEGVKMGIQSIFGQFTNPAYLRLSKFFYDLNLYTRDIANNDKFNAFVNRLGKEFDQFAKGGIKKFVNFLTYLESEPGQNYLKGLKSNFDAVAGVIGKAVDISTKFLSILFGVNNDIETQNTNTNNFKGTMEGLKNILDQSEPSILIVADALHKVANAITDIGKEWQNIKGFVDFISKPLVLHAYEAYLDQKDKAHSKLTEDIVQKIRSGEGRMTGKKNKWGSDEFVLTPGKGKQSNGVVQHNYIGNITLPDVKNPDEFWKKMKDTSKYPLDSVFPESVSALLR